MVVMLVFATLMCINATKVIALNKWTEFKTAYRLAKLGTLSATADELNIHRSTVMRHIDALEAHLDVKLFQRNDRGYIPTDAGLEVMKLGEITDLHFSQFANRAKSKEDVLEGVLKITCVNELSVVLFPAINKFQSLYPNVTFEIIGDTRQFDLEYGEADLAIRTGEKPETLDNIVISFKNIELVFCAHQSYIDKHGKPTATNLKHHRFLATSERLKHLPWNEWIYENISKEHITLTSGSQQILNYAMQAGTGIGITTKDTVEKNNQLHEISLDEKWQVQTWLLIHRDIINIPKVRKFVDVLKAEEKSALNLYL